MLTPLLRTFRRVRSLGVARPQSSSRTCPDRSYNTCVILILSEMSARLHVEEARHKRFLTKELNATGGGHECSGGQGSMP